MNVMTTALVLSAGGMWAAWEAGVWSVLKRRFAPDLIVGASAGAWNAWAIAGGATCKDLADDWLDPRTAEIIRFGVTPGGLFRPDILQAKAAELATRYRPRTPVGLTMAEVPRLKLHIVRDEQITARHLAAACSIPFGFPPVRIGKKLYVDGGLLGGLPLYAAEQLGATGAVALNVLSTPLFRVMRKLLWVKRASPRLKVMCIEPSVRLGSLREALVWSKVNVQRWIELGVRDGEAAMRNMDVLRLQ